MAWKHTVRDVSTLWKTLTVQYHKNGCQNLYTEDIIGKSSFSKSIYGEYNSGREVGIWQSIGLN